MNQQSLFNTPPPAAPFSDTSVEAAKKVTRSGRHGTIKRRVLETLRFGRIPTCHDGGMIDEEIAVVVMRVTGCRFSSVVSARNSLCNMKPPRVRDSGRRRKSPTSGMMATIWEVVR